MESNTKQPTLPVIIDIGNANGQSGEDLLLGGLKDLSSQVKSSQVKSRQVKASQGKSRQVKASQGKARQGKSSQVKSSQVLQIQIEAFIVEGSEAVQRSHCLQ